MFNIKEEYPMFSRYLYGKVKSSTTRFVPLLANQEELHFLQENHVLFFKKGDLYYIDSDKLKSLFCH